MFRYFTILSMVMLVIGCRQQPDTTQVSTPTVTIQISSNQLATPSATTTQTASATSVPAIATSTSSPTPTKTPNPTVTNASIPTVIRAPQELACPVLTNNSKDLPSGRILFYGMYSNGLHVINTDGTNLTRLTSDNGFSHSQIAISPDGSSIAYMSSHNGNQEIYVVNTDGSGFRQITNNTKRDEWPTWHPDNTKLAYSSEGVINVVSLHEGATPIEITSPAVTGDAWYPRWSPDGEQIAFMGYLGRHAGESHHEVFVVNPDGRNLIQLTDVDSSAKFPIWSPDSRYLIVSIEEGDHHTDIQYLIDVEKETMSQLSYFDSSNGIFHMVLGWLPDSKHVAIASNRDSQNGKLDIYLVSKGGTKWTRLTTDDMYITFSDFSGHARTALSPARSHIAFTGRPIELPTGPHLRIMKLDGTDCYSIPIDIQDRLNPIFWVP